MTHYTNTDNPIDFPKKKKIPMLERFAAQSLVESDGELIFSKEKFAQLIVQECMNICRYHPSGIVSNNWRVDDVAQDIMSKFQEHFGVDE
jgi:hypothetical protein